VAAKPNPDDAFDPKKQDAIAAAIESLSPEEKQLFLFQLEVKLRQRKLMLTGYLIAMFVWLGGMVLALAYYGMAEGFVGWVFLVPFGFVGVILWAFGKWATKIGSRRPSPELIAAARKQK
jgi:hypothetical protein